VLLIGGAMVRGPRDIVLVFLLVYCQFYVLRPVLSCWDWTYPLQIVISP
jgi:hypothetical protein